MNHPSTAERPADKGSVADRSDAVEAVGRPLRPPAMSDVAALAGVSHQTVSRVLNGHPSVREDTRRRVLDAIAALGYRRNVAARALATARSTTVGVVTTGSALFGPTSTLIAVEEAAREQGWYVSVATIRQYDGATMHRVLDHFMNQAVEGIVVIAPQVDVAEAVHDFRAPVPVVLIAAGETDAATIPLAVDQRLGARLATEYLLDLGHESVLHVCGPADWLDAAEREAGWRAVHEERGIVPPEPVVADWTPERGYDVGLHLADQVRTGRGPTAVFAANDQLALGMLRAFWERGISVPHDVSVVGFDDVHGAGFFIPPLTTVRQPFDELGRRSVALLLEAVAGREVVGAELIPPTLVRRASAGPPA